jgi:hypothetical protein
VDIPAKALELSSSVNNLSQKNNTVKSNTSVKHSIEENNNKTWREHLAENYEATGTRTYMSAINTDNKGNKSNQKLEFEKNEETYQMLNKIQKNQKD